MKKIRKKYVFIFAILLLILIGAYFTYKNYDSWFGKGGNLDGDSPQFGTLETIVEKKSFNDEVELTGNTKIKNEQKIKFNTSGRITEVRFNVGDTVKKGDLIVSIEASKAESEINKAATELDKSRRNLAKIVEDLRDSKLKTAVLDLETAKMSILQKEKDLVYLKEKQKNDLKSKENEMQTAKNTYVIEEAKLKKDLAVSRFNKKNDGNSLVEKNISYEKQKRDYEDFKNNFQSKLDKKLNEYQLKLENSYYDLEKDVRDFEKVLNDMGEVIGAKKGSFSYVEYFSAKNSSNIGKIKDYYYKAGGEFEKISSAFKKVSGKNDNKNIVKTLEEGRDFYDNAYLALTYLQQGFDDSAETNGFIPSEHASRFSSALSRASSMRSTISSTIDELKNFDSPEKIKKDLEDELEKQRIALENAEIEIKKFIDEKDYGSNTFDASQKNILISLEDLKINLNQKLLDYEKYKKNVEDEYRQAEIALEKEKIALKANEEEFQKLKNLSKNDEYLSAEEAVKQAELNLENARKGLENYIIQAPFDGVITKMDYRVGDRITENSEQYVSIVDPKLIEILVNINQTDIVKVKKGMETDIILDTYPDKTLKGTISEIDTTPSIDENTGISKFASRILIGEYGDLNLYTGMRALIKVKISTLPESIVVPFSAVNSDEDGRKYVTVVSSGKKEKRYVEVGEPIGGYYQIISGLEEGEKILEIDYDASQIKEEDEKFGEFGGFGG
ncbi:hypothetical protein DLH72_01090 [Candidatus Gracilibacteria bacterium]|nr:MAG: hypothetical protein DLH72_01090 [Candidatus Gracilibacteria bacterium]